MRLLVFALVSLFCMSGFSQVKLPFELIDNRVIVESYLNGRGPFKMIFDTGSVLVIDLTHTSLLGLEPQYWFRVGGAGQGQVWAYLSEIEKIELGSIIMTNREIVGVPLGPIKEYMGFKKLDGTFGKDLVGEYVVNIDFQNSELRLFESGNFEYKGNGVEIPYALNQHYVIEAIVEGIPAKLWVDTGDRSNLTLFQSFVDKHELLKGRSPIIETVTGHGVGGPIPAQVATIRSFNIGPIKMTGVMTRFPEHKYFPYDQVDGSIGTGMLKSWNLIFDNKRTKMIFEKNNLSPQTFDRSGLWLIGVGNRIHVDDVVPSGPADLVGLQRKDIILSVDGRTVGATDLPWVREIFSDKGQSVVNVVVLRQSSKMSFTIHLRDLI